MYNERGGSYLISATNLDPRITMEIKVYADRCLTCQEGLRLDVIRFIGDDYGLRLNLRRVYMLPELRKEADAFGVPMPFVELNGKTMDFYAVGKHLLKDKALEKFINEATK